MQVETCLYISLVGYEINNRTFKGTSSDYTNHFTSEASEVWSIYPSLIRILNMFTCEGMCNLYKRLNSGCANKVA